MMRRRFAMGFFDRAKDWLYPDDALRRQGRTTGPDGQVVVYVGPFAIATDEGRLICKNCGVQFDSATVPMAQGFYYSQVKRGEQFAVPCRKCDVYSAFLFTDVLKFPMPPGAERRPFVWIDHKGVRILTESFLPIYDQQERMLCRYCAVPLDHAAFEGARAMHGDKWSTTDCYFIRCSNCETVSAFMNKDLRRRPA